MATDPQLIITTARSWIGTPYVHQASVKGIGCDCVGLLRGVWRELGNAEPEVLPPYSPDWDVRGEETLRDGIARHLTEISLAAIAPGCVVLVRWIATAPAKHCAIVGERDGVLTMIHSRQNKQVNEEVITTLWRQKFAYAFEVP
jgi:NlpC/P60 family putative phage cell wall peptidase